MAKKTKAPEPKVKKEKKEKEFDPITRAKEVNMRIGSRKIISLDDREDLVKAFDEEGTGYTLPHSEYENI